MKQKTRVFLELCWKKFQIGGNKIILESKEIPTNDNLSHWILENKNIIGKPPALKLRSKELHFTKNGQQKMSVNSEHICHEYPEYFSESYPKYFHTLGYMQADRRTETKQEQNPESNFKEIYIGFCVVQKKYIDQLIADDHMFVVKHIPEKGNNAHCNISLKYQNFSKSRRNDICDELDTLYEKSELIKPE